MRYVPDISFDDDFQFAGIKRKRDISDMACYLVWLEYSFIHDEFSVSVWSASESRPVKLIVSTMYDVSIGDQVWTEKLSPQVMMQKRLDSEPLIVEVTDEKFD